MSPASFGWTMTCQQSSRKEKSDQLLVLQSFNLSNFNSISHSTFFRCTYLFVLFFDYLNRTLVARTPRLAISKVSDSLKSIIQKSILIFTRISLKSIIHVLRCKLVGLEIIRRTLHKNK